MEESGSDSDTGFANEKSDDEGSYYDEEFEDGDLPQFFCGTFIQRIPHQRSISTPTCPQGSSGPVVRAKANNSKVLSSIPTRSPPFTEIPSAFRKEFRHEMKTN